MGDDGTTERIPGRYVPSSFFSVLGVSPILGRTFTAEEDLFHPASAVVISHRFWQQWFGGDEGVVGKSITLDN